MDPNWTRRYGLQPTLRQLMILIVHFAPDFSLATPLVRGRIFGLTTLLLPMTLPLLSLPILSLDRPTPAKYWLVGLLASLFLPSLVAWCDELAVKAWRNLGHLIGIWFLLPVLNAWGIASIARV